MAFAAASISGDLARGFSIGPLKIELQSFSCVSTDTSASVTANTLSRVDQAVLLGTGTVCATAAPTISGTTVTLTLADPAAACTGYVAKNINGLVMLIGR